jgi:hypothetical protein
MSLRLVTAFSYSSRQMQTGLSRRLTVADLARYLGTVEADISTRTLEWARPVLPEQRLGDLNLLGGDRLLVFVRPPRTNDLPLPVGENDMLLELRAKQFTVRSAGKRQMLAGKPDDAQGVIPDVDLRYAVAPEHLDYVSRSAMWLHYDAPTWYVQRTGQNRVLLDEYEVQNERVPLNNGQRLRLYRRTDDPLHTYPLCEFTATLQRARPEDIASGTGLERGQEQVRLRLGTERPPQTVRVSASMLLETVMAALMHHNGGGPVPADAQAYVMRLVAPDTRITALDVQANEFLYAPLKAQVAHSTLILRDVRQVTHMYKLAAGTETVEKLVGVRLQPGAYVEALDADLYDTFTANGHPPHRYRLHSPFLVLLTYRATEGVWWVRPAERAQVPVYLNTVRLTGQAAPIAAGDVLTFGPSTVDYYARLEVDITAE